MPWDEVIKGVVLIVCAIVGSASQESFRRKRRYRKLGIRKPPSGEVIQ